MLLGGDQIGRDVFSRLIYGTRISLLVGILSVLFGVTIGLAVGLVSGYFGGAVDLAAQRVMDAVMAFPALILALSIMAVMGASIVNVIIALAAVFVPGAARTIRSQALSIKETDYILAARAIGVTDLRIMARHMAPNLAATYIVLATISLGWAIVVEASLSFLGVGVPPNVPTWGGMLTGATKYVETAWWVAVFPGLAIAVVVFAWNLLGDALRRRPGSQAPRIQLTRGLLIAEGRRLLQTAWWTALFPGIAMALTVLAVNLFGDWLRDKAGPAVAPDLAVQPRQCLSRSSGPINRAGFKPALFA